MPTLTLDGTEINFQPGQTVLEAAADHGIAIPTLCHHPDLTPVGSCRLCLVEVQGKTEQVAACKLQADEGLVVQSETPSLIAARRFVLRLLLSNYQDASHNGNGHRDNEFLHWVKHYGLELPTTPPEVRFEVDSDPNPFIRVDLNKCILCTRCVRACQEIQGRFVWGVGDRGHDAKISAGIDTTMLDARCESCGACSAYCPTGALDDRMSFDTGTPDRVVTTTCGYCGVGCQFDLQIKDEKVVRVASNPDAPVNGMSLCVKGRYGYDFLHHPDRLTKPQVRQYLLDGKPKPASLADRGEWVDTDWDTALQIAADRFAQVRQESGPDATAVFSSAKCSTEENYLMQKFSRQVLGTHSVDHCARLCHSSSVAALRMCVGSGAMSNSMDDIADNAQTVFIIGSNTTEQHPVFGTMLRQAVMQRGLKIVVADPRKIDITEFAVLHLRHKPGTDAALLNGIMHVILENGWQDQAYIDERCEDFEVLRETVEKYPPRVAAEITGVPAEQITEAAEIFANNRPTAAVWGMGITQHSSGVLSAISLVNLQMLMGNIGKHGGGVNPLRGQNNVQGACDMGTLPNVYPGYQPVTDEAAIEKFEDAWLCKPAAPTSTVTGLTMTEVVQAIGDREVRALYILGENPALTEPDGNHARECLEAAEFIVLQDIFPTESATYADVLLPSSAFAEKNGSFTNTDRRIQPIRRAIDPPGQSREDWDTISELARRTLAAENRNPTGPHAAWDYEGPAQIMQEIAALTPSYAGVTYERILRGDRMQWPVPDEHSAGSPVLHIDRFTSGKGKFHAAEYLPAQELPDDEYPLLLTTGRVLYHWHGGEQTRRAAGLLKIFPESILEISPRDAEKLQLADGQKIRVNSRRGEMLARAAVTDRVSPGIVFGDFHFPGNASVNNLTNSAVDPVAKIPEYKVCAVTVESAE